MQQFRRPDSPLRTPFPTTAPSTVLRQSPSAGAAIPRCAIGALDAPVPGAISRRRAIWHPTYSALEFTSSSVVAVPPKATATAAPSKLSGAGPPAVPPRTGSARTQCEWQVVDEAGAPDPRGDQHSAVRGFWLELGEVVGQQREVVEIDPRLLREH